MGVDAVSATVNTNLVMPPAQRGEVLNVMSAAFTSGDYVVDLEPVTAPTAINSATPVTKQHETSYFGGNHPPSGTHHRGPTRTLINHHLN